MLNIISLQALRDKSTGPSKVAKNFIKGLKALDIPFVINANLNSCPYLYILDDEGAFHKIKDIDPGVTIFCGPILHWKKTIPENIGKKYHFLYPSERIKNLGDKYKWHQQSLIRPVGIDTEEFKPSTEEKTQVLVYFKTRFNRELEYCESILKEKKINYNVINYDKGYQESAFKKVLSHTKYVIRIGRQETQGIALQEVLSMNIPMIVRDVTTVGYRNPHTEYEKKSYEGSEREEYASTAPYFDQQCGIKIYDKEELQKGIEQMEQEYVSFSPRSYIIEHLDYKKQAQQLLYLFASIHKKIFIPKKYLFPYKINLLIKLGFFFLDNPGCNPISKHFVKIYQYLYSIRK